MPKKRGNGEGSVYRRKDGLWVGQYVIKTPNGTKTKYIYSKSRKEAAAKLTKAVAEKESGLVYDCGLLTVEEYLDKWLHAIQGTVRERTWKRSEEIVRLHLVPTLGKSRLDRLNALQVQSLYRSKRDSGLSSRTVQIVHATLHKALKQAVRWSLIPRNITDAVEPPNVGKKEIKPLDEEQAKRLLKAVEGDGLKALYVLAITTGMRSGELLGLKWEDVDLNAEIVRVRRTVFISNVATPSVRIMRKVWVSSSIGGGSMNTRSSVVSRRYRNSSMCGSFSCPSPSVVLYYPYDSTLGTLGALPWIAPSPRVPRVELSYPLSSTPRCF